MIEKTFFTTREASERLGVCVRTTQLWVESGLLAAWKTAGGHRRVSRESVEALLHRVADTSPGQQPPTPDTRFKVLIVEDDPALLRLYATRLAQWPMPPQVIVASNGLEALVKVGREMPDLLIADLNMPEMDGLQLLRVLKEMPELEGLAMVVVSGLDAEEIAARGGVPEGVAILPKPVPFTALLEIAYRIWAQKLASLTGSWP